MADQRQSDEAEPVHDDAEAFYVPADIDISAPCVARVYDYLLGGKEHLQIDRRAAGALLDVVPETAQIARDNRGFLRRGVQFLVRDAGIRQIIDVGCGLPSTGNVHEVAHEIDPDVRVVYVDNDPVVLAHVRALLATLPTTTVVTADLRNPDTIFDHPDTRELVDFEQPFAVLLNGVVHYLADEDGPERVLGQIRDRISPGNYLLLSHFLDDDEPRARALERAFTYSGLGRGRFRAWPELHGYFEGFEMVEPGLVYANDWRPDPYTTVDGPVHTLCAAGIGRKL